MDSLIHWPPGPVVATVQCQGLGWVSRSQIVSQNLRSICDKHTIKLRLEKRVTGKDRKMQQHRGHFEYKAIAYMVDLR